MATTGLIQHKNNDAESATNNATEMNQMTEGLADDCMSPSEEFDNEEEEKIVNILRVHFGDPYTRCCREKKPWKKFPKKLVLLVLKLAFVTTQLCMFGRDRSALVGFIDRNNVALKHLLLKDWDSDHETMPYPPSVGLYAVYTITDLHQHIDYAVDSFYNVPQTAVGSFFVDPENHPPTLCVTYYNKGVYERSADGNHIVIDTGITQDCVTINYSVENTGPREKCHMGCLYDKKLFCRKYRTYEKCQRMLKVELDFLLFSVHVDVSDSGVGLLPECFIIEGKVLFDNIEIDGQIPVYLKTSVEEFKCSERYHNDAGADDILVAIIILALSCLSIAFSGNSFRDSMVVLKKTKEYFRTSCPNIDGEDISHLSSRSQWEILKIRDLVIFISDISTLAGTCFKLALETKTLSSSSGLYDACGILLGSGCMLVWLGVLHYLSYDSKFNLLFRVMERAASQVIRFLAAVVMLFTGFSLCGWVVLGPYHIKFLSLSNSFQCLISLLAGDELYVTYTAVDGTKEVIWWFNIIYITTFHIFFTIIAMNIFIAIFTSTYEIIQEKNVKSDLKKFLDRYSFKKFVLPDGCKDYFCCLAEDQECWRFRSAKRKSFKEHNSQ